MMVGMIFLGQLLIPSIEQLFIKVMTSWLRKEDAQGHEVVEEKTENTKTYSYDSLKRWDAQVL